MPPFASAFIPLHLQNVGKTLDIEFSKDKPFSISAAQSVVIQLKKEVDLGVEHGGRELVSWVCLLT